MLQKISDYVSGGNNNPEAGFAFFLDNSGSVGGSINYWKTVQQIIAEHGPKITAWYFWNSNVQLTSKKEIQKSIQSRRGTGGTSPQNVAQQIVNKKYTRIILITDGQVSDHSVQQCDKYLQQYKLEKSLCYIISSGSSNVNMSVTCPFTRNCDNEVYSKTRDEPMKKLAKHTPQDFKMLDALDEITLENFYEKFEKLEGLIIALNMGKSGNIPLKNQLVVMKNRLVKELSKNMSKDKPSQKIREVLEKKDLQAALQIAKQITSQYFNNDTTSELETKISHLINLCGDLRGKYDIGQIKSNRMAISKEAKQGKIDKEVEITEISKNLIDCPIIMEQDIPQILVDEADEPVLLNVDKNIVDDIVNCPLRILNYPQIKEKFKSRLSNFIGVKYGDKFLKNPFTQKKILGAIPLGCHHSHVKVGNYTLAQMLTGGKVLGNLNMYYAVVWYLIKEGNIQYLNDIQKNAEEHLVFRLRNSRTMISLCGLAQFVTTDVSSDVAVWYCANSGYFNQPTDRDTFRYHIFNMQPLIQMTKLLGYPIAKGTNQHLRRTKLLMNMLTYIKKIDTKQKNEFAVIMQCLYQKCMFVDKSKVRQDLIKSQVLSRVIPIDGQASEQQVKTIFSMLPQRFKQIQANQLYHIYTLADPNKAASAIFLDFNIVIPPLPKYEVKWSYGLKQFPETKVVICPKTFRPLYTIKEKTWDEVATTAYKVMTTKQLLKGNKYYEYFILKLKRIPENKEQLVTFFFNRYIINGQKRSTLPFQTEQFCQELINDYNAVFEKGFDFETVKQALLASLPIQKRKKLEAEIQQN